MKSPMTGWIGFAAIIMVIVGALNAFEGLIAIIRDEYYVVTGSGVLLFDLTTWGWIMLIWGGVLVPRGPGALLGSGLGALVRDHPREREHPRPARVRRERSVPRLGPHGDRVQHRGPLRADRALGGLPRAGKPPHLSAARPRSSS